GTAAQGGTGGPGGTLAQDGMAALGGAATPGGAAGLGLADQTSTLSGSLSASGYGVLGGGSTATGAGGAAENALGRAGGTARDQVQSRTAPSNRLGQLEALLGAAEQSGRPGTRIPDQQVGNDGVMT